MANIFPIDFEEKLTMASGDFILFSDSEDGNKIKKAQYSNLKWEQGDPWTPGADWTSATITVGTVTTGAPGSSATVTNSGTSSAAILNFSIPQWAKWEPWEDGEDWTPWADWEAATITVWTTTTLSPGSSATVTNVGTSSAAILNFWIPKWESGSWSGDVSWPASSTDWHLAVFDWATGKIIKDWGAIPTAPVSSVNSQTWAVVLDADDISDSTTTNKFVTATDKTTWGNKQDALTLPATPTQWNLVAWGANNKTLTDWGAIPTWVPSGWTDGQVLSKVSGSVAWATPSGWDVVVSSQSWNILTSWMAIRCGTETDYSNLGSYSNNTLYLTIE